MLRWKDKSFSELDRTKFLRNSGTYALLLMSLVAMTFFGVCDPKTGLQGPKGSAAKIDGDVISAAEFRRAYQDAYRTMQEQRREAFDPAAMQLSRNVMRQLVNERILYRTAVKMGLKATEEEALRIIADAEVFKDEKGGFNSEAFQNYLKNYRHTEATFLEELRRRLTVSKFEEFITSSTYVSTKAAELDYKASETKLNIEYLQIDPASVQVTVTEADTAAFLTEEGKKKVQEYYDTHKSEFNTEAQIKARHILVAFTGARNASADAALRSKDDAKKRAEDIVTKVKAPGADFAKIASQMTDEASGKTKGGDLGFFGKDAMVKEFSDAAFAMKVGDISGVVESPFGFHIIKVEAEKPAKSETVEQATPVIAKRLIEKDRKPLVVAERTEKLIAAVKAGHPESVMKDFGISWKETGEMAAGSRFVPVLGSDKGVLDAVQSLKTVGQVYEQPLDVRDSKFIVRLKSRTQADMAKLDETKKKELTESAAYSQGYTLLGALRTTIRSDLEKSKKIWENPDFVMMDERKAPEAGADAADNAGG